jgi:hypothetical protein
MKKFAQLFACLLLSTSGAAQKTENIDVSFPFDSYKLTPDITADLDHIYSLLQPKTLVHFNITGEISSKGGKRHRDIVAAKRAEAVRVYFEGKGIPSSNIYINKSMNTKGRAVTTAHKGSKAPEGLYSVRVYMPSSKKPVMYTESIIDEEIGKQEHCYTINPLKEDSIFAPEGTVLKFKPNTFEYLSGEDVRDEVVICIREYYSLQDIIMNDLATISNKRMLETGGMLHISATCKGYELKVKQGKSYVIRMPARDVLPRMKLFAGEEKGGIVDWKETDIRNVPAANTTPVVTEDSEVSIEGEGWGSVFEGVYTPPNEAEYVFQSTRLNWINCDRFPAESERTNLFVKVDTSMNLAVRVVFKDMRSVMPAYYSGVNAVQVDNIPVGEQATIICYKMDEKKNVYLAYKDIRIQKNGVEGLQLALSSLDEMKSYLKTLER